jgi:hypothetical protein
MNELGNVMVVKFKLRQFEKMLDVFEVSSNQVVHCDNVKTLFDKTITQMRPQKASGSCD